MARSNKAIEIKGNEGNKESKETKESKGNKESKGTKRNSRYGQNSRPLDVRTKRSTLHSRYCCMCGRPTSESLLWSALAGTILIEFCSHTCVDAYSLTGHSVYDSHTGFKGDF